MATVAVTLPKPRRRPRNEPAAGRARFPEIYFVKRIDNSRLRREVDPRKCRQCLALLGVGVLVFIFGLLFAWQHFQCVRYGYEIEQLKTQRESLEEWNHQLRVEQASLADPQRIDQVARRELGLVPPGPRQLVQVGDGSGIPPSLNGSEVARNLSPGAGDLPRDQ